MTTSGPAVPGENDPPTSDRDQEADIVASVERPDRRERTARLEAELVAENQLRWAHERTREAELVASIAVLVNDRRDALATIGAAAKLIRRHCTFAVSHVLVPDPDGAFVTADIWDADPGALEFFEAVMTATAEVRFPPRHGLPGEVAASHLALWLPDLTTAARPAAPEIVAAGASWALPVISGVDVAAVIEFVHPTPRAADEQLLQLAASIGALLGRAFEREALEQREIAERRRMEDVLVQRTAEVQRAKREAQLAQDARGAFLGFLAHEAQTALESLRVASHRRPASPDQESAISHLHETLSRFVAVVDGSERRILGERSAVALDSLVAVIIEPYAESEVPVVAIHGRDDTDVVTTLHVPVVVRAVGALIDNALAHSGGDRVEVSVAASPDSITIQVRDHGVGYTWPDNGQRPAGGGGLAQTKRLTQALGGTLAVVAEPDGGTCARVSIAARPGGPAAWVSHSTRVLLVDDSETNRRLAGAMLAKIGLPTDLVDGGAAALTAMRGTAYGLVLMDVQMPEIDGREATRRWRASEGGVTAVDVPIVALTAHVGQAERDSCRAAGMTDYLSKPFGIEALAQMARTYLDTAEARR